MQQEATAGCAVQEGSRARRLQLFVVICSKAGSWHRDPSLQLDGQVCLPAGSNTCCQTVLLVCLCFMPSCATVLHTCCLTTKLGHLVTGYACLQAATPPSRMRWSCAWRRWQWCRPTGPSR